MQRENSSTQQVQCHPNHEKYTGTYRKTLGEVGTQTWECCFKNDWITDNFYFVLCIVLNFQNLSEPANIVIKKTKNKTQQQMCFPFRYSSVPLSMSTPTAFSKCNSVQYTPNKLQTLVLFQWLRCGTEKNERSGDEFLCGCCMQVPPPHQLRENTPTLACPPRWAMAGCQSAWKATRDLSVTSLSAKLYD